MVAAGVMLCCLVPRSTPTVVEGAQTTSRGLLWRAGGTFDVRPLRRGLRQARGRESQPSFHYMVDMSLRSLLLFCVIKAVCHGHVQSFAATRLWRVVQCTAMCNVWIQARSSVSASSSGPSAPSRCSCCMKQHQIYCSKPYAYAKRKAQSAKHAADLLFSLPLAVSHVSAAF